MKENTCWPEGVNINDCQIGSWSTDTLYMMGKREKESSAGTDWEAKELPFCPDGRRMCWKEQNVRQERERGGYRQMVMTMTPPRGIWQTLTSGISLLQAVLCLACPVCGKTFGGRNRKQNLGFHLMIHTGEKRHQCPYCPHKSTLKFNLIKHIRNIHGDMMNPMTLEHQFQGLEPNQWEWWRVRWIWLILEF